MEVKTNVTSGKMTKEEKKEQRRRYISSYREKIPNHIIEMAKEKKLYIERSDECARGYNGQWVKTTDKRLKQLRKIKLCGYKLISLTDGVLGGKKHDLSLDELINLIETYELDMEKYYNLRRSYIKPMSSSKWKNYYLSKRILRKLGLRIIAEGTRFWIIDQEGKILFGNENGISINGLLSRSLKLEEANKAGGKKQDIAR